MLQGIFYGSYHHRGKVSSNFDRREFKNGHQNDTDMSRACDTSIATFKFYFTSKHKFDSQQHLYIKETLEDISIRR